MSNTIIDNLQLFQPRVLKGQKFTTRPHLPNEVIQAVEDSYLSQGEEVVRVKGNRYGSRLFIVDGMMRNLLPVDEFRIRVRLTRWNPQKMFAMVMGEAL